LFPRRKLRSFRAILFGLIAAAVLAGCAKKRPSRTAVRQITQEIVASARTIVGPKAEITIRPVMQSPGAGRSEQFADSIYISPSNPSQSRALEESLAGIARRHKLGVSRSASDGIVVLEFSSGGVRTQTIHIVTRLAREAGPSSGHAARGARLAIIVDDLGYDPRAAQALLGLPFRLTVSVIPHLQFSTEVAEDAFRRGDEVLLHLPMQAEPSGAKQEKIELRMGMDRQEVASTLAGMLETVPHAVGVNNHEGSLATADPALMQELMPALRQRGLFFVDSRTTAATVAYTSAEEAGVRAASRKVFLDDVATVNAVRAQLQLAVRDAQRNGSAIAIGHPHPATIAALSEAVPQLEARGIRFVFVSDLVH